MGSEIVGKCETIQIVSGRRQGHGQWDCVWVPLHESSSLHRGPLCAATRPCTTLLHSAHRTRIWLNMHLAQHCTNPTDNQLLLMKLQNNNLFIITTLVLCKRLTGKLPLKMCVNTRRLSSLDWIANKMKKVIQIDQIC